MQGAGEEEFELDTSFNDSEKTTTGPITIFLSWQETNN